MIILYLVKKFTYHFSTIVIYYTAITHFIIIFLRKQLNIFANNINADQKFKNLKIHTHNILVHIHNIQLYLQFNILFLCDKS